MGPMGNGGTGSMGYRGMGHMGNRSTGCMEYKRYGQWVKGYFGYG